MKTILAAIDFSPVSESVVQTATSLARATHAALVLLHVEAPEPEFVGYDPGPQTVRDSVAKEIMADHRKLHDMAESLRNEGMDATALVVQGATAEKILEEAQQHDSDCIVLGSHGHGSLYDLLVGSVCDAVIRKADRPVMLIPRPGS